MADGFEIINIPFIWQISLVIAIIIVPLGITGYLIATRSRKQPFLLFLARYGLFFLLLFFTEYAIIALSPTIHAKMCSLTANLVGGILTIVGVSHSVSGTTITLQNPLLIFDITAACLGGMLFWTYAALVFAEPKLSNKQRLIGIAIGLVILVAFNFLRITLSIYLEWLTSVHVHNYLYLFNIFFVLTVWAGWLIITKQQTSKKRILLHS